jgi:regulator of protease activity HflC (stomatin/prohibitin superfamily)
MTEKLLKLPSGWLFVPVFLLLLPGAVAALIVQAVHEHHFLPYGLVAVFVVVLWLVGLFGFLVVNPNEARVIQLFGRYVGTVKDQGFYYGNPFYTAQRVSLRVQTFETGQTKTPETKSAQGAVTTAALSRRMPSKVNDKDGTPIEIAAIVVWRVVDGARSLFDVDHAARFVQVQTEAALRNMATSYPYDAHDDNQLSLRGSTAQIAEHLKKEVQDKVDRAGVEILDARISHLAYAPEIAQAMLQRQQAAAIIAARQKIVEGAVGMVEMALARLSKHQIVVLDEERKAQMVSNLLVVLCGERSAQPVVNAGTLYT